jgi:hypothetical protein
MHQATLAEAANVTRNVIIDFENGRRMPGRNNLATTQRAGRSRGGIHQRQGARRAVEEEEMGPPAGQALKAQLDQKHPRTSICCLTKTYGQQSYLSKIKAEASVGTDVGASPG